jgi:hypothetical protein
MNPEDSKDKTQEDALPEKKLTEHPPEPDGRELKSALQKMSEGKPQILQEIMAMGFSSGGNPLHQKMNEQHVTQVLDLVTKHDERQFELTKTEAVSDSDHRKLTTWFGFIGALIFCALLIFIIFMFKDKPEVLTPILTGMGGLVGGGLAGFGIGKSRNSE